MNAESAVRFSRGLMQDGRLAVFALLLATPAVALAQTTAVFSFTNQTWRYEQDRNLDGTGWEQPGYNDSAWPSGLSLLGFDGGSAIEPLIRTPLIPPVFPAPGLAPPRTYYFRTWFDFQGDPAQASLVFSNRIDDGAVFHLNGAEIARVRMPAGPIGYTNLASTFAPFDSLDWDVFSLVGSNLVRGTNLLAVSLHNVTAQNDDAVFGATLHWGPTRVPELLDARHPADVSVAECSLVSLRVLAEALPFPSFQWFKDDSPIALAANLTATNHTLTLDRVLRAEAGRYHAVVSNAAGMVTSRVAMLDVRLDEVGPVPVSARGETNLGRMRVSFSDPLDRQAVKATNIVIRPVCGGAPLDIVVVNVLFNPESEVQILTAPRNPAVGYEIEFREGAVRDACPGNPNRHWVIRVDPGHPVARLSLTREGAGFVLRWNSCGVLERSLDLKNWGEVLDQPASPYPLPAEPSPAFYRLRTF